MRRRLLATTLAAVAAVVLLLGVPLAVAVRSLLVSQALDGLQREAEQAQVLVGQQGSVRGAALLLSAVAEETGSRLTLVDRTGPQALQIDTGGPPDDDVFFGLQGDLDAARSGTVGRATAPGIIAVAVPVRAPGVQQVLRASRTDDALRAAIRRAWAQLGALAVVALGVAAVIARWQGARFGAPLESLAAAARALGEGDFSVRAPRSGLPEPDQVAAALDVTADRLAELVARSRSFGADASHQLRTPLTALRLQLEALQVDSAEQPAVIDALAEVDRLDATIDELLALGAPETAREPVDLEALVTERVGAWRALARAQGRRVVVQAVATPRVRVRPAAIGQSLQVLLDNALEHGAGTVTVSIQPVAGGVRLAVGDEGPGIPDLDVEAGPVDRRVVRGRGLPMARSLVEAEGGHLRVERPPSGGLVALLLPAEPGAAGTVTPSTDDRRAQP
jgi:signal transduction histidine kinase